MKRLLLTFLSVLALNTAFSQLVVDNTVDAVTAVEDILVGEGIDVFNITFSGEQNQIGSFNSENSNIPITNGVISASLNIMSYFPPTLDFPGEIFLCNGESQVVSGLPENDFAPNSDGDNDFFLIHENEGFPRSKLEVYNHCWGQLVYESVNYQNNWRGDGLAEETYYIFYKRSDNEIFTGTATLLSK